MYQLDQKSNGARIFASRRDLYFGLVSSGAWGAGRSHEQEFARPRLPRRDASVSVLDVQGQPAVGIDPFHLIWRSLRRYHGVDKGAQLHKDSENFWIAFAKKLHYKILISQQL